MAKRIDRTGETAIAKNGMLMTIIEGNNGSDNLTVKFEDGTIIKHVRYYKFKAGNVAYRPTHIGEKKIAKNGMLMTIIDSNGWDDKTIKFEDNTIVYHVKYSAFKTGEVKNHNLANTQFHSYIIGETNVNNQGHKMTIINAKSKNNIDVQFEDKTLVKNRTYYEFISGSIMNPNFHINEQAINKNGLLMTITKYKNPNIVEVNFETGYKTTHTNYYNFIKGSTTHKFPYQMNNILIEKPAYVHNNIGNFYCKCSKCKYRDIWTINEAKNHKCEEIIND